MVGVVVRLIEIWCRFLKFIVVLLFFSVCRFESFSEVKMWLLIDEMLKWVMLLVLIVMLVKVMLGRFESCLRMKLL